MGAAARSAGHVVWTAAVAVAVAVAGCSQEQDDAKKKQARQKTTEAKAEDKTGFDIDPEQEPIKPLPEDVDDVDPKKMKLGRKLFFDPALSQTGDVSCHSCHSLDHGGAEPRATSEGINAATGPINAPTVLNARYNFKQFWDGRAEDLQAQAAQPVVNPVEMGMPEWSEVIARLKKDETYKKEFAAIYDEGITQNNVTDAIAEYEKALVTPSPFDRYLRGDPDAISEQAKRGYETFKDVGCVSCHQGINVGGTQFKKMGLVKDYFSTLDRELTSADMGRYNVTDKEEDRHVFKVPSLRNVQLTAPYFHDGSKHELEDVVPIMAEFQLGRDVSEQQVDDILAFLRTLTGDIPDEAFPTKAEKKALGIQHINDPTPASDKGKDQEKSGTHG